LYHAKSFKVQKGICLTILDKAYVSKIAVLRETNSQDCNPAQNIQILDKEVEEEKYRKIKDIKRKEELKAAEKEHTDLLETFKNKTASYEKKLEEIRNQNYSTEEIKPSEERSAKQEKEVNLENTKGTAAEEKKVATVHVPESKDKDKANSKPKEKEKATIEKARTND